MSVHFVVPQRTLMETVEFVGGKKDVLTWILCPNLLATRPSPMIWSIALLLTGFVEKEEVEKMKRKSFGERRLTHGNTRVCNI